MAKKLLELRGVSLAFGGLNVLTELDLHVAEGEVASGIGPNRAGKTTPFSPRPAPHGPTTGRAPPDGQRPARSVGVVPTRWRSPFCGGLVGCSG